MMNMDTLEIKVFQETVKTLMEKIRRQELIQIDSIDIKERENKIREFSLEEKETMIETILFGIPLPEVYIDISDRGCWRLIKGNYLFLLSDFMLKENFLVQGEYFPKMPQASKEILENNAVRIIGLNIPDPDICEFVSRKMLSLHF